MTGETWVPANCGDDKLSGDGGAEYPCVRRYRHRRLLTFLWLQGFQATHESMLSESDVIMWLPKLKQLVLDDQWQDANLYLSRFLPREYTKVPTSVEAMVLRSIFNTFNTLANFVVGEKQDGLLKEYLDHKRTIWHPQIRLRSIILNVQQARASFDWERVKEKAADILGELAIATPELKDHIFMPRGPMKPHNVLPVGFGFRRRCRPKKQIRKPKSPVGVAKSYLKRWGRLPASSDPSLKKYDQRLNLIKALDRMADILDECLKAGKLEEHSLQTTETKAQIGARKRQRVVDTTAANLGWTQEGGYLLNDINNSLDDVSSSICDLCLMTNTHNKDTVKNRVLSTLVKIKHSIALLVAQTAANTMAGVTVPLSRSNVITEVDGAGPSVSQSANVPPLQPLLLPVNANNFAASHREETTDIVKDSLEEDEEH